MQRAAQTLTQTGQVPASTANARLIPSYFNSPLNLNQAFLRGCSRILGYQEVQCCQRCRFALRLGLQEAGR